MLGRLRSLAANDSGQFSIMLAVAMPMLLAGSGMAIDLANQQRFDNELQQALDSGTLAGAAIAYEGATQTQIEDRIKAHFLPACPVPNCASTVTLYPVFADDRLTVTARGTVNTHFMSILGKRTMPIDAQSQVTLKSVPAWYEVHMVLDNTGSMNIIDGVNNIRAFRNQFNPWGSASCAFACHDRGGDGRGGDGGIAWQGETGADLARRLNFPMREDRLRDEMIDQAEILLTGRNATRVKVATYDFDWWVYQRISPSSNFGQVKKSIDDMRWHSPGTNHNWFADELSRLVGRSGDGMSASSPRKAIVLITDGVSQINGSDQYTSISPTTCNKWKQDGRELFVLYMVYPDPREIGSMDSYLFNKINTLVPQLEPALQACASPGRYYRAEYGATIDQALQSIRTAIEKDARQMYLAM